MRGFALVLGTLLATGALPAASQPAVQTPFRHDYVQDAQARLRVWSTAVTDFNKAARARGEDEDKAAGTELNMALTETKAEENKLEVASAADWDTARATFDHASRRFVTALDRARSDLD